MSCPKVVLQCLLQCLLQSLLQCVSRVASWSLAPETRLACCSVCCRACCSVCCSACYSVWCSACCSVCCSVCYRACCSVCCSACWEQPPDRLPQRLTWCSACFSVCCSACCSMCCIACCSVCCSEYREQPPDLLPQRHTYKRVLSHKWISHGTLIIIHSRQRSRAPLKLVGDSFICVLSQWMSHGTGNVKCGVLPYIYMNRSCPI